MYLCRRVSENELQILKLVLSSADCSTHQCIRKEETSVSFLPIQSSSGFNIHCCAT